MLPTFGLKTDSSMTLSQDLSRTNSPSDTLLEKRYEREISKFASGSER